MTILYAKSGGPPDNWQNIVAKKDGKPTPFAQEVDVLGCWAMVAVGTNPDGSLILEKQYGRWTLEEQPSATCTINAPVADNPIDQTVAQPGADQNDPGDAQPGAYGYWPVFMPGDTDQAHRLKFMGGASGRWGSKEACKPRFDNLCFPNHPVVPQPLIACNPAACKAEHEHTVQGTITMHINVPDAGFFKRAMETCGYALRRAITAAVKRRPEERRQRIEYHASEPYPGAWDLGEEPCRVKGDDNAET